MLTRKEGQTESQIKRSCKMELVQKKEIAKEIYYPLLGMALLIVGAWIRVPFYPIPFTMQTLAVFLLGLTMTPRQAFNSVILYLICASFGLPVFTDSASTFWLFGKTAGYLVSFPLAAYLISHLKQKVSYYLAVAAGQALIYSLGFLVLSNFLGVKMAFIYGVVIFIPSALVKNLLAVRAAIWINK